MTDRPSLEAPVNRWPVNQAALHWLRQTKADVRPWVAYLPQLAAWAMEQASVLPPLAPGLPSRSDLQLALGQLQAAGNAEAARATTFLLGNPNLSPQEQSHVLLSQLQLASGPQEAGKAVLETLYDRLAALRA